MQQRDGTMTPITEESFKDMAYTGKRKVARIGDVFQIRMCCFEVSGIEETGIIAKGIKYADYLCKKRRMAKQCQQKMKLKN